MQADPFIKSNKKDQVGFRTHQNLIPTFQINRTSRLFVMNPAVRTKVMCNWKVSEVKRQEKLRSVTNSGINLFLWQLLKS